MSFSHLLKRSQGRPGSASRTPERPASATASAEFWRAFLGQDARPTTAYVPDEAIDAFVQPARADAPESRQDNGAQDNGPQGYGPSVEPREIARELGLSRFASVRALQRLRREFALKNHPDRVPSTLRLRATKRMMIANALIDSAVKRFQQGARPNARGRPFESGERV